METRVANRYTKSTAKRTALLRALAIPLKNLLKYLCSFLFLTEARNSQSPRPFPSFHVDRFVGFHMRVT